MQLVDFQASVHPEGLSGKQERRINAGLFDFSSRKAYTEGVNPSSGETGQADYQVTQARKTE